MAAPIHPAARLMQLARENGTSVTCLARVIGRSEGYLRRRIRGGYALDIRPDERSKLSRFFGVPLRELGG
ncbi:MAG: helix-turn-helix transcriptional regulator [Pseudomonadota bacterium]